MQDSVQSQMRDVQAPVGGAEMRGAQRFALMLRSAKLIAGDGEFLCIIRDVSETGVKLRLFHPVPRTGALMIETASGQRYAMQLVWEANNEAGFRFADRIDVDAFVSESGPYPKRPLRLRVHHSATLRTATDSQDVIILDISRQGARIEAHTKLAIGQKFWLEARELPLFEGTVCWRKAPDYGVVFGQVMGLEELAQRAERMDRLPNEG